MLTFQEILTATKGKLFHTGELPKKIRGISINTRTIKKGDLFIAIKGDRFDGHNFLNVALQKGAAGVVCSRRPRTKAPCILVKDTVRALGHIALAYRRKFSIPAVAITGSAGKTTTKELIAAVLSAKYKVLRNVKTENNHIGVPMTLLRLKKSHQVAVLELGTNQPGDMPWLGHIVRPSVCVFTNVGESHLERLKSPAGVFREKASLLRFLGKGGTVIYNKDDRYLQKLSQQKPRTRKMSFSLNDNSDFQGVKITLKSNRSVEFTVKRQKYTIQSPAVHNVYNALAGICCGKLFRLDDRTITERLRKFSFKEGRFEFIRKGKSIIINDTYNANPLSFKSAVRTLSEIKSDATKIVVCADMLELGKSTKALHEMIGQFIARADVDALYSFGRYSRYISRRAKRENSAIIVKHFIKREALHSALEEIRRPVIMLIKGSRGMQMEKTLSFLVNHIKG